MGFPSPNSSKLLLIHPTLCHFFSLPLSSGNKKKKQESKLKSKPELKHTQREKKKKEYVLRTDCFCFPPGCCDKFPEKSKLELKGLILAHNCMFQSIIAGETKIWELEGTGHIRSVIRNREESMHACLYSTLLTPLTQFRTSCLRNVATYSGQVSLLTVIMIIAPPPDMLITQPHLGNSSLKFFSQVILDCVLLTSKMVTLILVENLKVWEV